MKLSIKVKIIGCMCLVVLITMLASGTFAYCYFTRILRNQALNDDINKLNQTARQFTYLSEDIKKFAYSFLIDSDIQNFLGKTHYQDALDENRSVYYAMQRLRSYMPLNEYIHSMVLIGPNGKAYWNVSSQYDSEYFTQKLQENWYQEYKHKKTNNGFTLKYQITEQGKVIDIVGYGLPLKRLDEPERIKGELIINLRLDFFRNYLAIESKGNDGFVWLGEKNEVLYAKFVGNNQSYFKELVKTKVFNSSDTTSIQENKRGYLIINRTADNAWQFISFTSKTRLYKKIDYVFYLFLIFIFTSMAFAIAIFVPLIFNVTNPIVKLSDAMKKVSGGELDVNVRIQSGDELETLGNGFNQMVKDLQKYIRRSLDNEKAKKEIEFKLLISQINPHFIYNTLNTVIYYARRQGNQDIVKLMSSFIKILQDAVKVSEQGVMASLSQEIEIVEHYIVIQKYKHIDRFDLVWDVDEKLKSRLVPRTILQPLVENALNHGVLLKDEKGLIQVSVKQMGTDMEITIVDNGVGMDQTIINQLLSDSDGFKSTDSVHSIGIPNIRERIKFLYGNSYKMNIESLQGAGTKITIVIPLNEKEL
jgi:two-component system, sensor histidine kinase YesM